MEDVERRNQKISLVLTQVTPEYSK